MNAILDLYNDYLISSFGEVTATGLSELGGGQISHDKIPSVNSFTGMDERTPRVASHVS